MARLPSSLRDAVIKQNLEAVLKLANADNVNVPDSKGYSPLAWAAKYGGAEIVRVLVGLGANPLQTDSYGEIPTVRAIRNGHAETALLLLQTGGYPRNPQRYWTTNRRSKDYVWTQMVLSAAEQKLVACLRHLVGLGANLDAEDENSNGTSLLFHCATSRADAVESLCQAGADMWKQAKDGGCALHLAVRRGHIPSVEVLIENGSPLEIKDKQGFSPLYLAVRFKRDTIERLLLAAGASPLTEIERSGATNRSSGVIFEIDVADDDDDDDGDYSQ